MYGLYYIEVASFYTHFLKHFYHKWVLNFVEAFLYMYWDDHMDFIFQFVNMVYHIDWFVYIGIYQYKPNLIMVYEISNVLLNSVC